MSLEDMPAAPWNFSGKISGTSKMRGSSTGSSEPYMTSWPSVPPPSLSLPTVKSSSPRCFIDSCLEVLPAAPVTSKVLGSSRSSCLGPG